MTRTTDKDRLLRHLIAKQPVRVTDWSGPETPDGGKPIMRVAARIKDLRNDGWAIERTGKHNSCAVYGLTFGSGRKAA